jgi:hypothetical protein
VGTLFGVTNIHAPGTTELIEGSVVDWLRNGLLEAGGFLNVSIPASGVGNSLHILREATIPGAASRTVFQSSRADWVWESGVSYGTSPTRISGVYVNGTFTGFAGTCRPDYPNGRVVFSTPVASGATVAANYSCRTYRVFTPRTSPWFYEITTDSFDAASDQFSLTGSGVYAVMSENRVQMPAVFVRAVPQVRPFTGIELGTRQRVHRQDVIFNIFADNPTDRDRMHDALVSQWESRFTGINTGEAAASNHLPISFNGNINPSGLGYSDRVTRHPWKQIRITDSPVSSYDDGEQAARIFQCVVRWTIDVDIP